MKSILLFLVGFVPFFASAQLPTQFQILNNLKIAYKITLSENRKPNEPVIVFESGLGMGGGNFETVFQYLPKDASYFVYDRNGLGESQIDPAVKTDSDVVDQLHTLLVKAKIKPPYLLVGHSIGGAFVRLFESKYPDEVAGMVFIDPTDFMLSDVENAAATKQSKSKIGYRELWPKMLTDISQDKNTPNGLRAEAERELRASEPFFAEYQNLKPLGNIPVAVLIAYNRRSEKFEEEMNAKLGLSGKPWFKAFDDLRIEHYSKMIATNDRSFLMLLPQYSHGVHNQDPELVGNVISYIFAKADVK
ncbi:MAG: alpha/beta hydrolase [Flavobacterium sp.]|uniref:alpha/beta hydrolase n=1 Tax=Flavobacterium sp. TaxID=239 RepID=UPI001225B014|nr:alpha/beta hydrolase [Flavobacterium sp.]RZJ68781.1 MAG: alpha/beta hydrolase [Flavobacterium sp.]